MNCPNCGAGLKIQANKAVCEYCGYEEPLPGVQNSGNDDFFNMVVFNESPGGNEITISIPECNIGFILRAGEAVARDIPSGYHTIVVTCEGMTEYRSVFIPNDGRATKVYISRAVMGISIRIVEPGKEDRYGNASTSGRNVPPEKMMSYMALIFSIIFPIIGLVFAIIDVATSKRDKKEMNKMTLAAFIIVGARVVLILLMFSLSFMGSFFK